ncbi:hypothetical protein Q8W71_17965 [Methylobacterium sp. NEAU 140]|uniref:hypothetical protein n=1 Tax=Methylobacterium sp. NEAU 140 TaxID=3064945 RepID=UPI0027360C95|nr:hypothetical protein [Methylobacterium sp. NEAU 140]MDP4024513.1 hypothetical protein [Methylobacterium sp. NEAU 140]
MNGIALAAMLAMAGLWLGLLAAAIFAGGPILTGLFALTSAAMVVRRDWFA